MEENERKEENAFSEQPGVENGPADSSQEMRRIEEPAVLEEPAVPEEPAIPGEAAVPEGRFAWLWRLPFRYYVMTLIAGSYMAYAGYCLFRDSLGTSAAGLVIGVICMILGAVWALFGLRGVIISPNKSLKDEGPGKRTPEEKDKE